MRIFQTASLILIFLVFHAVAAMAAEGVIDIKSNYTAQETADRLKNILEQKGMTIFTRIPHSESATKVGVELRNTELFIFGNPKVGSPLMKCQQSVAIDLPQKALIWEDDNGQAWISYNDPSFLMKRHAISGCDEVIAKIEKALSGITNAAVKK
jgi:uncharacterized protein (DUF302 family)